MDYLTVYEKRLDDVLRNRTATATMVGAEYLLTKTNATADEYAYSLAVFQNPQPFAQEILGSVLAKFKDSPEETLDDVTDEQLQLQVNQIMDEFVAAYAATGSLVR